jgi:hypothetical protein
MRDIDKEFLDGIEPEVVQSPRTPKKVFGERLPDADIATLSPADAKRQRDKHRKRKKRDEQRAALEAGKIAAKEQATPIEEWWMKNRALLDEVTRARYVQLHEATLDQMCWLDAQIRGTYSVSPDEVDFFVSLEEGTRDLNEFIKQHGLVYSYDAGVTYGRPSNHALATVELFREDETFRAWVNTEQKSHADKIWLTMGLLIAIPHRILNAFRARFAKPEHVARCQECGAPDPKWKYASPFSCAACMSTTNAKMSGSVPVTCQRCTETRYIRPEEKGDAPYLCSTCTKEMRADFRPGFDAYGRAL